MNIAQYSSVTEWPVEMVIKDPVTLKKTDGILLLWGYDSAVMQAKKLEINRKRLEDHLEEMTPERLAAERLELHIAAVAGWKNIYSGENELDYSRSAVAALLEGNERIWLRDQIQLFLETDKNFIIVSNGEQ